MWQDQHAPAYRWPRWRWATKRAAILRTNRDYFRQALRGRRRRPSLEGRGLGETLIAEIAWSRWWDDRRGMGPD